MWIASVVNRESGGSDGARGTASSCGPVGRTDQDQTDHTDGIVGVTGGNHVTAGAWRGQARQPADRGGLPLSIGDVDSRG